ncbi:MAG: hypothetical protein K2J20_04975 [Bacilli bacterium]|nr:hypothetical protein [Bacilli bacterium]
MKFETLNKSHSKRIIIGIVALIAIALVGIFATSRAKYQSTQTIPLVKGTITTKVSDFTIMAIKWQKEGQTCTEDSCYDDKDTMPTSGYAINESKSSCTLDGNPDTNAILKTVNGRHTIETLSKKDKC